MADPRIYTGAEALALLEGATPGPWWPSQHNAPDSIDRGKIWAFRDDAPGGQFVVGGTNHYLDLGPEQRLMSAAPDLAASVAHHAEQAEQYAAKWVRYAAECAAANTRADKAEAEVESAVGRLVGLVGDRAPLADMIRAVEDGIRTMEVAQDAAIDKAEAALRAAAEAFDGGETSPADLPTALGEYLRTNAAQVAATMASDRQASETCADLRRQLLVMTVERDRLARVLAVEMGAQAPDGWGYDDDMWLHDGPDDSGCDEKLERDPAGGWTRLGATLGQRAHYDFALEAMEAIAAGVPHE